MTERELQPKAKEEAPAKGERVRPGRVFLPSVDIFETPETLVLVADMPGVTRDVKEAEVITDQGHRFMPLYDFDVHTGTWLHKTDCTCLEGFSLEAALACQGYQSRTLSAEERRHLYTAFLTEASRLASELGAEQAPPEHRLGEGLEELRFFSVPEPSIRREQAG